MEWSTTRFKIDLTQPKVMGIVNVTPDSFSDGGRFNVASSALQHCESLIRDGADILDIGGESSRPGAPSLSAEDEWARLEPVLAGAVSLGVPISVDTCKPVVMQKALDLGVDIVNDIKALMAHGAQDVVVQHGQCGLCLMHMQGVPQNMQTQPNYLDLLEDVCYFLKDRSQALIAKGVHPARLSLDPGIGFGKTPEHNIHLLRHQQRIIELGLPVLVGWSRKSTLGHITGREVGERLSASIAAALACVQRGAHVLRVHDVGPTVDALKVWAAAGLMPS